MLECIVQLEGGFKTLSRDGTKDPMTLFGIIDSVWARSTHQHIEIARKEMKTIGLQCEPYPHNTKKYQAHDRPKQTISDKGLITFNEGREKAIGLLFKEYLQAPRFDQYPEFIQLHLLDFGINKGPARARWALVDAMLETGALKKDELNKWFEAKYETPMSPKNLLTAKQAVSNDIFRAHNPGSWYADADLVSLLELHLQKLKPEEQKSLVKAYGHAREEYYNARVNLQPAQATHLEGWLKRIKHINACSLADIDTNAQTQETTKLPTSGPRTAQKSIPHR